MTDILIRDVPDEVLEAIDERARRAGVARGRYLLRVLEREFVGEPGEVSIDDLRRAAVLAKDLADPAVMSGAWS